MNRSLLNILMLVSVVGLALVAVYKPGQPPEELPAILTTKNAATVQHIRITRANNELELEKRGDTWWVLGEPDLPADPVQVESLLRVLSIKPARTYAASELDLAQLELAPAALRAAFDSAVLEFGATDPLDGLRYVKFGERVSLIADNFQNILQGKRAQLASRKLLPPASDINSIELPELRVQKDADGNWAADPAPDSLSADAIPRFVQAWSNANALWVREYQPGDTGEAVFVQMASGERIAFEVRRNERETVFARADIGLQYNLPEYSAKQLLALPQPEPETMPEPDADAAPEPDAGATPGTP